MGVSPMSAETADDHTPGSPVPSGTLVYDGDCGFCTAAARWARRRLNNDYRVIASQQADLDALGLTEEDVARSAWWVHLDGTRSDEHRSIAAALLAMSAPWPAVGRLLTLGPISPLARAVYRLVANNRRHIRWPGSSPTCSRQ